ncbi:MAG: sigma-70 family RNA polymerase sigma factor [Pirellulales bacterium]
MPLSRPEFVTLLTKSQKRIYGFIGTLVVDRNDADDVLQETNTALWEMADQFEPGTDFVAWACKVAHFRIQKQWASAKRLRVRLSADAMNALVADAEAESQLGALVAAEQFERHRAALAACLEEVSARNRDLLLQYYEHGKSLADIGLNIGRNRNAVAQLFHRVRAALRSCIRRRLAAGTS